MLSALTTEQKTKEYKEIFGDYRCLQCLKCGDVCAYVQTNTSNYVH